MLKCQTIENTFTKKHLIVYNSFFKMKKINLEILLGISSIFSLFLIWWLITGLNIISVRLFPSPSEVYIAFIESFYSGEYIKNVFASLKRIYIGIFIGSLIGIIIGFLTGLENFSKSIVATIIHTLRPIPIVAMLPLVILWFGIGELSKIFLISWAVFMLVWINTHMGVRRINKKYFWIGKSMELKHYQKFWHIIFPATIPNIVVGLRIAIPTAFIVLVVAELSGSTSGLGHMISTSHLLFRLDRMLVGIISLGILGALTDIIFYKTIKKFVPWYNKAINGST